MKSRINRRDFFGLSSAAILSGVLPASAEGLLQSNEAASTPAMGNLAKRPNIILFMPDELRADSLACYGNPLTKTPNFDRLAAEGTRFANCHVQFPVCGASRCSLLTGWPTSVRGHRSLQYFLRPEEPNLFRYLKRSGYDVFWYGKNDALAAQTFYDSVTTWSEVGKGEVHFEGYNSGPRYGLTPGSLSFLERPAGDRRTMYDYALVQSAIGILDRKETDKPFCIFLPMIQPHPPYTVPADFYNMYNPKDVPRLARPDLPKKPSYMAGMREYYGLDKLGEDTFRKIRAVYYGKVSYSDWLLGHLMEAVERTHHAKDTAVFVLSDHGDYGGDYGLVEKWSSGLEDCLTHVPLIAKIPGGVQGNNSEEMVELFDVMQTCLDLGGIEAEHTHFSRSLCPQVLGKAGDKNRAAFAEGGFNVYEPQCFEGGGAPAAGQKRWTEAALSPDISSGGPYAEKARLEVERPQTVSRSAMVRTRNHKLIMRRQGQCELYDQSRDPLEEYNLFGESRVAALQDQLERRLLYWYMNTTGIAPFDKDQRNLPPSEVTRAFPDDHWKQIIDGISA